MDALFRQNVKVSTARGIFIVNMKTVLTVAFLAYVTFFKFLDLITCINMKVDGRCKIN